MEANRIGSLTLLSQSLEGLVKRDSGREEGEKEKERDGGGGCIYKKKKKKKKKKYNWCMHE